MPLNRTSEFGEVGGRFKTQVGRLTENSRDSFVDLQPRKDLKKTKKRNSFLLIAEMSF